MLKLLRVKNAEMEEVIKFAKKDKDILAVYLFGSRAVKKENAFSDYDLAVLLRNGSEDFYHAKQLSLASSFGFIIGTKKIDILILNNASPRIIHQVIKYGKVVYQKSQYIRAVFEARMHSEYLDYKYYYDIEYGYLLNRIKNKKYGEGEIVHGRQRRYFA